MQDAFSREVLGRTLFAILRVEYRDACKDARGFIGANLDAIANNTLPVSALPDILNALELKLRRTLLQTDSRDIMMSYSKDQGDHIPIGEALDLIWELCLTSPRPASPATQRPYAMYDVPPSPLANYLPAQARQAQPTYHGQAMLDGCGDLDTRPDGRRHAGTQPKGDSDERSDYHEPLIMYSSPAPQRTQRVDEEAAVAKDQLYDLKRKLDQLENDLAVSKASVAHLKLKEAQLEESELLVANLEDDKRLLSEQLAEVERESANALAVMTAKVEALEQERTASATKMDHLFASQHQSAQSREALAKAKEENLRCMQRIHQLEEQKRIAKESSDLSIKAKEATITDLTRKMEDLHRLLRQTPDAPHDANVAEEKHRTQVLLLEDYIVQLERDIDRYKSSLDALKEKESALDANAPEANRMLQRLQGDFVLLSQSCDAATQECDRLSGELNVLQADKQRLEATCDALRKQRASPPMTEVQKSLLSWVDDTRHTLKSANASNDDLPLLVSVMEGSLDRQAERIHALLSRSGSEAFESTIQHDTTVASDQVLDTSNDKEVKAQKEKIDALNKEVETLRAQKEMVDIAPPIVHTSVTNKLSLIFFAISAFAFMASYLFLRLAAHYEAEAPEWLTRLAYSDNTEYQKVLCMS